MKTFITASTVWLVCVASGRAAAPEANAQRKQPIWNVTFAPDGKSLAVAAGPVDKPGTLTVWNVGTRKPRWVHREKVGIPAAAFSPDGKLLAIGSFGSVAKLLDAGSGKVLRTFTGHTGAVRSVAFMPGGRKLITGGDDRTVKVWNTADGSLLKTYKGHTARVYSVAVSPDGENIVSAGDRTARIWEADGEEVVRTFGPYSTIVPLVGWSTDGRWLVTGCWDGIVRIHDSTHWKLRARVEPGGGVRSAVLTSDGSLLAVTNDSTDIRLFRLKLRDPNQAERRAIDKQIAAWSNDDIATRNKASAELIRLGLICMPQLRTAMKSKDPEVRIRARRVRDAVRAPEPSAVLTGHTAPVHQVAFSPDGTLLASGDKSGRVKLWNARTRRVVATWVVSDHP